MVERSLRMRQVQGSMPCTSIRGAGPLRRREGDGDCTHKVIPPQRHTPVGCPALSPPLLSLAARKTAAGTSRPCSPADRSQR